jgi:hypothetical protein
MTAPALPNDAAGPGGGPPDHPSGHAHGHAHGHPLRRALAIALGLVVLLALLAVAALLVATNTNWGREQLRRRLVAALEGGVVHGRLRVGRIGGNLLKGLSLHDVAITDSAGNPFFRVDSARVRYGLGTILRKRLDLAGLTLWRPDVVLDRRPGQDWNFARIFPSDTTKQDTSTAPGWGDYLIFRDARVVDGRLAVRTPYAAPDTLPDGTRLTAAQKDSAVRAALDTASRARVEQVPGGYQRVTEVQRLHAGFPLIRLADPAFKSRRVEVDSARALAFVFRPPPADIRALRGAFEIGKDSLWFRDLAVQLPASRATVTGRYDLNSGALALRGRAAPVSLADARFALPSLPAGTVTADYDVAITDQGQRYVARGLDFRATNPDGSAATATGTVALATSDSAGRSVLRVDSTDVAFTNVQTGLVAAFAPGTKLPVEGAASGSVRAAGTLADLRVAADVTFDERRAGRSRVRAEGGVGVEGSTVTARDLRVALEPVQVDLARRFSPDLPVGGTLRGRATVDGSTATGLVARGVDLTHADRTGTSRVTGRVEVALASARAAAGAPPSASPNRPRARGRAVAGAHRAVAGGGRGAAARGRRPHAPPDRARHGGPLRAGRGAARDALRPGARHRHPRRAHDPLAARRRQRRRLGGRERARGARPRALVRPRGHAARARRARAHEQGAEHRAHRAHRGPGPRHRPGHRRRHDRGRPRHAAGGHGGRRLGARAALGGRRARHRAHAGRARPARHARRRRELRAGRRAERAALVPPRGGLARGVRALPAARHRRRDPAPAAQRPHAGRRAGRQRRARAAHRRGRGRRRRAPGRAPDARHAARHPARLGGRRGVRGRHARRQRHALRRERARGRRGAGAARQRGQPGARRLPRHRRARAQRRVRGGRGGQ